MGPSCHSRSKSHVVACEPFHIPLNLPLPVFVVVQGYRFVFTRNSVVCCSIDLAQDNAAFTEVFGVRRELVCVASTGSDQDRKSPDGPRNDAVRQWITSGKDRDRR